MGSILDKWRATFGWQRRREFISFLTGDDRPLQPGEEWRRFEYKRPFLRSLIRSLTAADQPGWVRVVMNSQTKDFVRRLSPEKLDALEISGEKWSDLGFRSFRAVHYPDFDICNSKLDESFDFIVAEQVFEHLLWPYRAGKNVYEMLRPGGCFHISTPFLLKVHGAPLDCSRWTEVGIKHFLAECGFPIQTIVTGSWGNRACARRYLRGNPRFRSWLHSLENEPEFPMVVWAFATKPTE